MEIFDPRTADPEDFAHTKDELMKIECLLEKMRNQPFTTEEYRCLQFLLMKYQLFYQSNCSTDPFYPLCQIGVKGDKIMFISDTHRGNKYMENKRLIDIAYNVALKENIKAVVHAGDFIEACPVEHDKKFEVVLEELYAAMSDLPNEITTGLLLGNHDYSAIRTHKKIIPHYFNFPKIEILGMQKVLLNWDGQAIIRVNHPISQLKEPKEENQSEIITLEGHHHFFDVKKDFHTINLPSLSTIITGVYDQTLADQVNNYCSLFVIAEKQGDIIQFIRYCIDAGLKGYLKVSEIAEVDTKTKQLKWCH